MRKVTISSITGGINRLRSVGEPSAAGFYDLVNAYVTPARTIKKRPGLALVGALGGMGASKGIFGWEGKLWIFGAQQGSPLGMFQWATLRHPSNNAIALKRIRHVSVFLRRLYVVAEFDDGVIRHYWLQNPPTWAPDTHVKFGRKVSPTVISGLQFEQNASSTAPSWRPNTVYAIGDKVQPSAYNGFEYTLTAQSHVAAASSNTEPDWPIVDQQTITDRRPLTDLPFPTPETPPEAPDLPGTPVPPPPGDDGPNQPEPGTRYDFPNPIPRPPGNPPINVP